LEKVGKKEGNRELIFLYLRPVEEHFSEAKGKGSAVVGRTSFPGKIRETARGGLCAGISYSDISDVPGSAG
jgi:hypothetical protein